MTLVDAKAEFVQRLRLHQVAAGLPVSEPLYPKLLGRRVQFVQGVAETIDVDAGIVMMAGCSARGIPFDRLIYAVGSVDDIMSVPGVAEHAHRVADRASARQLRAALASAPAGARVVVVGGGLTGIEVASELAPAYPGVRVTLVTRGTVGGWLTERARAYLAGALSRLCVDKLEHTRVMAVGADGRRSRASRS